MLRRVILVIACIGVGTGVAEAGPLLEGSLQLAQAEQPPAQPQPAQPYQGQQYQQQYPQGYPQQYPPGYQPGYPQGQPYYQQPMRYESRPHYGLIIAGSVLLGVSWMFDWSITLAAHHDPQWESFVPVVGPILQLTDSYSNTWDGVAKAGIVMDLLVQSAGLAMLIAGAVVHKKVLVRAGSSVNLAFVPGPAGHGQSLAFTF